MGFNNDLLLECIGAVTIVTEDRLVFQGQILKDEHERHCDDDPRPTHIIINTTPEFIRVRLTCDPAIIEEDGDIEEIEPDLFEEGDVIRINVNEILAIGPSRECLGEDSGSAAIKVSSNP